MLLIATPEDARVPGRSGRAGRSATSGVVPRAESPARRWRGAARRLAGLLLLCAGAACDAPAAPGGAPPRPGAAAERAASRDDQEAIRAGYLERLRMGLGSPFRLADLALADPRLEERVGRETARELIERTADADLYELDPAVLLPSGLPPAERVAVATRHLRLVERTVAEFDDPRAGELAVRLAYRIGALEQSVQPQSLPAVFAVAALARDRELAIRDARALRAAAREARVDPVTLVPLWRRLHRFRVEAPVVMPLADRLQLQALRSVPSVLTAIRMVGGAPSGSVARRARPPEDGEALRRLQVVADSMDMPPRAALVTALRGIGSALPANVDHRGRHEWTRFAAAAEDEERFASRYREVLAREPALRTALAVAALYAAVGLRVSAQEPVWFPGTASPSAQQLRARHGLIVQAGQGVPGHWTPYFLTALDESVFDLKSVFPVLDLSGLTIDLARESRAARSLASYRAGARALEWPVTTGPGALAHEIAHDLDAQAARRQARNARGYASEGVPRPAPASLVAALAVLTPPAGDTVVPLPSQFGHARRPAEVLARAFDWFVITRLAARGRWNGALSSAQDGFFTGNGSLGPPGVSREYGPAVIEAVRSIALIPESERAAFLAQYGRVQWPTSSALLGALAARLDTLHRVGDDPADAVPVPLFRTIATLRDAALEQLESLRCQEQLPLVDRELHSEFRELITRAARARARGAALEAARRIGGVGAVEWMTMELNGLPRVPPDDPPGTAASLQAVAEEVRSLDAPAAPIFRSGFDLRSSRGRCVAPVLHPLMAR